MLCLLRCYPRTIPQQQMLILASKTSTSLLSITSSYSLSGGHRSLSTLSSQKEIVVDCLPNKNTPWLMLRPEIDKDTEEKFERFYSPAENQQVKLNRTSLHVSNSAKCVGSTIGGWLGYTDPNDCSMWLSNPYSNDVVQLPSLTTLPSMVEVQHDPVTGAVISVKEERGDFRGLDNVDNTYIYEPRDFAIAPKSVSNMALSQLTPRLSGSVVVAIQGNPPRLVYCPIGKAFDKMGHGESSSSSGVSSLEWLGLQEDYRPGRSYHQAVYSSESNRFYTMFKDTGIQAYDLTNDRKKRSKMVLDLPMEYIDDALKKVAAKQENAKLKALYGDIHDTDYYLVPFSDGDGDLLLLVQHYRFENIYDTYRDKILHFDVFKVDFRWKRLERVDSLRDHCVFVGLNQSFALLADRVAGLRPNSIYFSDDLYGRRIFDYSAGSGIFDMRENSVLPFGYEEKKDESSSKYYPQFWVAPFTHCA